MRPPAPDQAQRAAVLDPQRSFIVRAPAGSGKTELLIQRHLRLLACVTAPEEVLAITFTRKAAAEMRGRLLRALNCAANPSAPDPDADPVTLELARAILRDPARAAWNLPGHPARLNIGTIDSVNSWLAGRAPLAGGAALHGVTPWPEAAYRAAAEALLQLAGEEGTVGTNVRSLLQHLDNDARRFVQMLAEMLPRREQWLRQVLASDLQRSSLERPLRDITTRGLQAARELIPAVQHAALAQLLRHALHQPASTADPAELRAWDAAPESLPGPAPEDLPRWLRIANALLTREGNWRRKLDKRNGFPPGDPLKARMLALIGTLSEVPGLEDVLAGVRDLPGGRYPDDQWQILNALLALLPTAAAALRLEFATRGETDFPEIAAAALQALGSDDAPTELGLALDVRIGHILVDEFQDTSRSQFRLLEQMLAGWAPGDGRTLFLVGDPMQSIYGFREADVRLFDETERNGIGALQPVPLQLTANFRAEPRIVDWVNATFAQVLPEGGNAELGAVGFTPSTATRAESRAAVGLHWLPGRDTANVVDRVVSLAAAALAASTDGQVCILVRTRQHAAPVITALRRRGITFVAPDVEDMLHSSVAQDLLALTRVIAHRADRLAWLAVLRAPFCGLSLADLHALAGTDHRRDLPELLGDATTLAALSAGGRQRAERLSGVLGAAMARRGSLPLRDVVEAAWVTLGGPACLAEVAELDTAELFLRNLAEVDRGWDLSDPAALWRRLERITGSRGERESRLQVMTIHKAKGLEFDTVILPFLERRVKSERAALLLWHDTGHDGSQTTREAAATVFAAVPAVDEDDRLFDLLSGLKRQRLEYEEARLLYVGCTRARTQLHLVSGIRLEKQEGNAGRVRSPPRGSLLRHLWPAVRETAEEAAAEFAAPEEESARQPVWVEPLSRRIPADWQAPALPCAWEVPGGSPASVPDQSLSYDWATRWAMHVGSVVHRWLEIIARDGVGKFDAAAIEARRSVFRRMLEELGTDSAVLDKATDRVVDALIRTVTDPRGRWILSGTHREAASELSLTVAEGGRFRQIVLDRTFIADSGERWIVDYKTSAHEGGDLEAFLTLECERYRVQLEGYRNALTAMGEQTVRTALYFPLLAEFREITSGPSGSAQNVPAKVTE